MQTETQALIRAALIDLWVRGKGVTNSAIAAHLKAAGTSRSSRTVASQITRWRRAGVVDTQLSAVGLGENVQTARFGGEATREATLKTVLTYVLTPNSSFPAWAHPNLRTALRTVLELPMAADLSAIMTAAQHVSADKLRSLPDRYVSLARARGVDVRMIGNLESLLRRALRCAADADRIPLVFEHLWGDPAWEALRWRYFADESPGISQATIAVYRSNFAQLAREAVALFSNEPYRRPIITFESLSEVDILTLRRHLRQRGKRYLARQVQTILSYIARTYGEGPYANRAINGRHAIYLRSAEGFAASRGTWPEFLAIFESNSFKPEWLEFLEWYRDYSTLPDGKLAGQPERFPPRPRIRHLAPSTVVGRMNSIRAWVGMAFEVLKKPASEVTLIEVFGVKARFIAERLKAWWADRAMSGEVSDATSEGLTNILLDAAMIARALCDRAAHERGVDNLSAEALSLLDWEASVRTRQEEVYFRAYMTMTALADQLMEARRTSDNGHGLTTSKDITRMVQQTPPQWWLRVLDDMLARIHTGWFDGRRGERFLRLIEAAYLLGFLISTGLRRSELAHIRLGSYVSVKGEVIDRQYGPRNRAQRIVRMRAVDRKNQRQHRAALRDRFCPLWLEQLYLEHARPFFLAKSEQDHDWLFVTANGQPYGCLEETDTGERSASDILDFMERKSRFTQFFQNQLAAAAAGLGLTIPEADHEFGFHAVRGVFAYLLFQSPKFGVTAAANWLGDRVATVEGTYAEVDGTLVDVSQCRDVVTELPIEEQEEEAPASKASTEDYGTALGRLIEAFKCEDLTRREYEAARASLAKQHGVTA